VKYAEPEFLQQFLGSHPALIDALRDFEAWLRKNDLPEPTLTQVWRTPRQQEDIYFGIWKSLLSRYKSKQPMTQAELKKAIALSTLTDEQLRERAREKFSWHLCRCAVDIRARQYSEAQMVKIAAWLTGRCPAPIWEIITEEHGTGIHVHCAMKSFEWRRKYTQKPEVV
jgi:tryptophan 2,3-dioxygenase